MIIKPCPCGETPKRLSVFEGSSCKYGQVSGSCCGSWEVEFNTQYKTEESELLELATKAWNDAPRKSK